MTLLISVNENFTFERLEVTLNMFLLARIFREASAGVYCSKSQHGDCKEIGAHPVPRAGTGGHIPLLERCGSADCTETCPSGLELAQVASVALSLPHLLGCGMGENVMGALLTQYMFSVA